MTVGEKTYPIGRFFESLTRGGIFQYDEDISEALKKNGYTVERDGGHMRIVKFRRMKDEKARDFLAIYEDWIDKKDGNGELLNIRKIPDRKLELPNLRKPGEMFQFGSFMQRLKHMGHSDDEAGTMAAMLEKGGFTVIRRNNDDKTKFDGLEVPGAEPSEPRKLTPKQEKDSLERIKAVKLWVAKDRGNFGKVPLGSDTVTDDRREVHKVGQMFQVLRTIGYVFHEGLFEALRKAGFKPERTSDSKIILPRDKSAFVSVDKRVENVKDLLSAYDAWLKGVPGTTAPRDAQIKAPGTIPPGTTTITLSGRTKATDIGLSMYKLVNRGMSDPTGKITELLQASGLQTDVRNKKVFVVNPEELPASGVVPVSAATQKNANSAAGITRDMNWENASGSGVPAVSESVILPPGVEQDADYPGLCWVGAAPTGQPQIRRLRRWGKQVAKAAVKAPVIVLRSAMGDQSRAADLRNLRRLVQQFALKKQPQPMV
ncbi:hypothetical protein ACLQ24_29530, partial [Micromonospora sp. DT4]|uniref:hypothetical protein n=1 Tax=Micromonospora sp. DT4 TaxID=3393438 RepID=UPI003CF07BC3